MIPRLNMKIPSIPKLPEKKPESWQEQKIILAKAIVDELRETNKKLDIIIALITSPEKETP